VKRYSTIAAAAVLLAAATSCDVLERVERGGGGGRSTTRTEARAAEIDAASLRRHLVALQRIADAHGGTRATGTPGYEASVRYVAESLRGAGYQPRVHRFTATLFRELAPPELVPLDPARRALVGDEEIVTMQYSPSGRVAGRLAAVDLRLPPGPPNSSTSGCDDGDFAGFPRGAVALLQRGGCFLFEKVRNAETAGAAAAVVMNEGQRGRRGAIGGTLVETEVRIPVLSISSALGESLARASERGGLRVRVATETEIAERSAANVIADLGGRDEGLVLVGAHLDSVSNGPGINDNGSGVAAALETARILRARATAPAHGVRFAFWAAEELGLVGSDAYAADLASADRAQIVAVVNLDMLGSRNAVPFVYDGDGSGGGIRGPGDSAALERLLREGLAEEGVTAAETPLEPNSDHAPFLREGVAVGGLFSGADGVKTAAEATRHGGESGEPYDRCYHRSCDSLRNVDVDGLLTFARAAATAVARLASAGA